MEVSEIASVSGVQDGREIQEGAVISHFSVDSQPQIQTSVRNSVVLEGRGASTFLILFQHQRKRRGQELEGGVFLILAAPVRYLPSSGNWFPLPAAKSVSPGEKYTPVTLKIIVR